MRPAFLQDEVDHRRVSLMRAPPGPTGQLPQSLRSSGGVTLQPLVAGLATDRKVLAQLRDRETAGGRQTDEL